MSFGSGKRKFIGFLLPFALVGLAAGCSVLRGPPPETYDLTAPREIAKLPGSTSAQILIPESTALKALDSERIVVTTGAKVTYYPEIQWSDRLPKVIQAKTIEAFEQSRRARAVGRPGDGLSIDYQLLTEVRAFEFENGGGPREGRVEIYARILNDRNGRVVAAKLFSAATPVEKDDAAAVVGALDASLNTVLADMVRWTLGRI